jgi:hypothetical protein
MPAENEQARPSIDPLKFELEKWEAEQARLEKEFGLREREVMFKEAEARRARLWNPLAIAVLGAAIAAAGSALVSWENGRANLELETFKTESARVFEVVKTGNPDTAARNLQFLLETGLIQNTKTVANLRNYLGARRQGEGVALPASDPLAHDCRILRLTAEVIGHRTVPIQPDDRSLLQDIERQCGASAARSGGP